MSKALKIISGAVILMVLAGIILWYPYKTESVPEWRVQVIDASGQPVAGVQANEEWIDPIEDGIVSSDSRSTDSSGSTVFPQRQTHNRLAVRLFARSAPSAHIFVCWRDQTGDIFWEVGQEKLPTELRMKKGSCPYG